MPVRLSASDRLLCLADDALRMLAAGRAGRETQRTGRPCPGPAAAATTPALTPAEQQATGALMRVNHAGEIAAQGLYHGQSLAATDPVLRAHLRQAAREEGDHLAWCRERLDALGGRPSRLDPLWYAGAVAIGAAAALVGDRTSLGFVVETERQVEAHLGGHLERLPAAATVDRAVLEQMRADERDHGAAAQRQGAAELPTPLRGAMHLAGRVMTTLAHRW
jgi:ubiquinone biosynthesis monooxygenase Coq7